MRCFRSIRLITACLGLFSMLFMQLAVAAYVCPMASVGSRATEMSLSANAVDMTNCDGMDHAQASLCHLHAYGDQNRQSADNSHLPVVQPFVPASLLLTLHLVEIVSMHQSGQATSHVLTRSTAPPLAIRHCCFRI